MEPRTAKPQDDNTTTSLIAVGLNQTEYKKRGSEGDTLNKPAKRKTSLLGKLRRNYENHIKSKVDSSKEDKESHKLQGKRFSFTKFQDNRVKQRRESYSGPSYTYKKKSYKLGRKFSRSQSCGSRELTSRLERHADSRHGQTEMLKGQTLKDFQRNDNEPKDVPNENKVSKSVMNEKVKKHKEPKGRKSCVSLYSILRYFELIAVNLQRKPEEKCGIVLTEVDEDSSVGQKYTEMATEARVRSFNSIITDQSAEQNAPPSVTRSALLIAELREKFRRSVKQRKSGIKEPLSFVATEENYQPRHGVRIVGLTEQGVATRDGTLAVDDLIVEVRIVTKLDYQPFYASVFLRGEEGCNPDSLKRP